MRVLVKEPGKVAYCKEIGKTLESYQRVVGGFIENLSIRGLNEKGILLTINEEGKLHDFEPNLLLLDENRNIVDCVYGTIMFSGSFYSDDGLELSNITDEQIAFLEENIFNSSIKYINGNNNIVDSVIL